MQMLESHTGHFLRPPARYIVGGELKLGSVVLRTVKPVSNDLGHNDTFHVTTFTMNVLDCISTMCTTSCTICFG